MSPRQAAAPAVQRIAILRFENLGSDPSTDWMSRGFAEVITRQLTGAPGVYAISQSRLRGAGQSLGARPAGAPGISAQRASALAIGANRLGYGQYSVIDGRIEARLTIEDPATGKMIQSHSTEGQDAEVIQAATRLTAGLLGKSTGIAYSTANSGALQQFCLALGTSDAAAAEQHLERAIAADPDFLPPYRFLADLKAGRKDLPGARSLLEGILARGKSDAYEAALIEAELARFRGDNALREQASAKIAGLSPLDPTAWRSVAETALARRRYAEAAAAYSKALQIEPDDPLVWNQYGYAAGYADDLPAAMAALRRYQSMRPADVNPLDSMGDVNLLQGKLKEAENFYLEAARKDPNFASSLDLWKAATARLMTGDIAGADGIAKQYVDARVAAKDPLAPYRAAEWNWVAGRRKQAYREMEILARAAAAGSARDLAARAYAQLAVWNLMLGEREAAASTAGQALSLATQVSALPALIARFLAQPQTGPAEWSERTARIFPNAPANSIKDVTLTSALLFAKEFAAAAPLLRQLDTAGATSSDIDLRILLAWSLIETGSVADAAPLLRWNPLAPAGGPGAYLSFYFPRIFYLRAAAAEKAGRTDEAKANYRLFLQLSGPDPLMWGEEEKAKAAL